MVNTFILRYLTNLLRADIEISIKTGEMYIVGTGVCKFDAAAFIFIFRATVKNEIPNSGVYVHGIECIGKIVPEPCI